MCFTAQVRRLEDSRSCCLNVPAGLRAEPEGSRAMILLIHLLQHLGIPSGIAIAVIIAGRKLLKGGISLASGRRASDRDRGRDWDQDRGRGRDWDQVRGRDHDRGRRRSHVYR
jgi:hypothetical protein